MDICIYRNKTKVTSIYVTGKRDGRILLRSVVRRNQIGTCARGRIHESLCLRTKEGAFSFVENFEYTER